MTKKLQVVTSLMIISILLGGVVGCAQPGTPVSVPPTPTLLPTPTLPPGWVTYNNDPDGQCGFAIDHPSDMEGASQDSHSWILRRTTTDPDMPFPNFIYVSVIPDGFKSTEPGAIYNYNPAETQALLNIPVGESRSLREDPTIAPSFTYTRLPDAILGNQAAQKYTNTQPWEFPPGTKEIRYYLQGSGCTFLVGGYLSTVGSGQTGAIDEDLFEQISTTFRLR